MVYHIPGTVEQEVDDNLIGEDRMVVMAGAE
jgi:hypothetical protein